jgi:hypothetical protein
MKYFVNILKQFTQAQRLIVLILLLSFTTGATLVSQYLKTDDCKPLIEENLKMHEDFAKISAMLRAERMRENQIVLDTIAPAGSEPDGGGIIQLPPDNTLMDSILSIAESNNKK